MNPFSDPHHARAILLLSVAAFASAAAARLCDPMLPALARDFAAEPSAVAHVVSGFSIAYGLMQVLFGPLAERIGKYRLIALTTLACAAGSFAAALAGSLDLLVAARLATGATAAGIIPLSMAWIGDTVEYSHRQATLARFLGGQIVGMIGGQFIGGLFTDTLGWRAAFGFLALAYLVVGALVLRESAANPHAAHRPAAAGAPRAGVLAQMRHVLSERWARVVLATVFVEGMLVFGALAFVPSWLHERDGLTLTQAGALMGFFGLGGFCYVLAARRFVRALGEAGLAKGGGLAISAAWALLALAPSWVWTMPAAWLAGIGFYMLHNTLQTNATQMAPAARGTAVSLFASAFFLGQSLGVALAAALLAPLGLPALFGIAALLAPLVGAGFARQLATRRPAAEAGAA